MASLAEKKTSLVLLSLFYSALFHLHHSKFQHGVCRARGVTCDIANTHVPSNPRINSSSATSQPYKSKHARALRPSFPKYSAGLQQLNHRYFSFKATTAIPCNHTSSLRNQETAKIPPHARRQCRVEEESLGRCACVAGTHVRVDRHKTATTTDGCIRTCEKAGNNTKLSITIRYDQRFDPETLSRGRFLDASLPS